MSHESKSVGRVEGLLPPPPPPVVLGGSAPAAAAASELDCRIYALVVLGEVMRWGLATTAIAGAIVGAIFLTPYLLFALAISPLLIFFGCALANTIRWPDGSIHIPYLTSNAFIPGQPIGFRNTGNNCFANAALQVAFASPGVINIIERLPEEVFFPPVIAPEHIPAEHLQPTEHRLRAILYGYLNEQNAGRLLAEAQTQNARLFIRERSPDMTLHGQEDGSEFFRILLDAIADEQAPFSFRFSRQGRGNAIVHTPQKMLEIEVAPFVDARMEFPADATDEQIFIDHILGPYLFASSEDQRGPFGIVQKFTTRPDELFFSAKRTSQVVTDRARGHVENRKINDPLPIPMRMTLPNEFFVEENGVAPTYEADAFFIHLGGGMNSGHYIAYKRCIYQDKAVWWKTDDSRVSFVSDEDAHKALKLAYTVHYSRI